MITPKGIFSLLGAVLIMVVIGSLYCFGALSPYIASYLHYHGSPSIKMKDLNLINPISFTTLPIGIIMGYLSSHLAPSWGPRSTSALS